MTEQLKNNRIEEFVHGLEDVVVCKSKVSDVDGQKGVLTYRGFDVYDLCEHATFEEVTYLLLFGALPAAKQLADFKTKLISYRRIPSSVIKILKDCPPDAHPMTVLRTGISALGCTDLYADDTSMVNEIEISYKLISQIATVTAAIARVRSGKDPISQDSTLGHAANFVYMMTGHRPDKLTERVMDMSLILHADHELPASTFSALVVNSSLTDMYSSITAAIGSLKGPLHGGANETAVHNMLKIGSPDNVKVYMDDVIAKKKKVPGIGHRVYKTWDPRAVILKKYAKDLAAARGMERLFETAEALEKECVKVFGPKKLYPNVDFYSGIVYLALDIMPEIFTLLFAVARISGWTARVLEYLPTNRIFRPRALYEGDEGKKYIKIEDRG
ncbi:MAG: citrate synthase/methylcitrate synthase [Deltaproteobacteria bacterium]|nr:citrate synthase/methylcitrate synthase [Deltaproteobacteria bacterium]